MAATHRASPQHTEATISALPHKAPMALAPAPMQAPLRQVLQPPRATAPAQLSLFPAPLSYRKAG